MRVLLLFVLLVVFGWLARSSFLIYGAVKANQKARLTTKPYNHLPANSKQHILVLGDSIMYSAGVVEAKNTMGGLLAQLFSAASVETCAQIGARIKHLPQQLQNARFKHHNLVVVGVGGNDVINFTNFKTAEKNLRDFLKTLTAQSDQVILIHSVNVGNTGFFLPPVNFLFDRRTRQLSYMYNRVAKDFKTVEYINFYRPRRNDFYDKKSRPKFIAADKFHPSDYGNQYFFKLMRPYIKLDKKMDTSEGDLC